MFQVMTIILRLTGSLFVNFIRIMGDNKTNNVGSSVTKGEKQ